MRRRVLFVATNATRSFFAHDLEILGRQYEVTALCRRDFQGNRRWLPAVARALRRHDLVYVWFAAPHDTPYITGLAKLLRRRSVLVVGGYDLAAEPDVGYGALLERGGRRRVRMALRLADLALPFSNHAEEALRRLAPRCRSRRIYPGVDPDFFSPGPEPKERLVLTAATLGRQVWRRKGLDLFARCAARFDDARFVAVGRIDDAEVADELKRLSDGRLEIVGERVPLGELRRWYRRAAVYLQLSAHEGFGLAVAEAMACSAVPVAARRGSLPEVVGDTGHLVDYGDVESACDAVRRALSEPERGDGARRRVVDTFAMARRERQLGEALTDLLAS